MTQTDRDRENERDDLVIYQEWASGEDLWFGGLWIKANLSREGGVLNWTDLWYKLDLGMRQEHSLIEVSKT